MRASIVRQRAAAVAVALAITFASASVGAQTRVVAPKNSTHPSRTWHSAPRGLPKSEARCRWSSDEDVRAFVERIGRRLEAAVPGEFAQPKFRYTFEVVNASDINAFALPGGPIFINRGMIAAARNEGEVAAVMAHELSHVVLRHGTAQASKAQPYELGALAGAVIGAIVGGAAGGIISQGTQFGLGTVFLRYSRDFEKQADILGVQIMAAAGYDPRSMATMFQTIQQDGGSRMPQWLSSHPDPGNRSTYVLAEAKQLEVASPVHDTGALQSVQADLRQMPLGHHRADPEEHGAERHQCRRRWRPGRFDGHGRAPVDERARAVAEVPRLHRRLRALPGERARELAADVEHRRRAAVCPRGRARHRGRAGGVHSGIELGIAQTRAASVRAATDELLQALSKGNPQLRTDNGPAPVVFAGRDGLQVGLTNVSEATGNRETVVLTTALLDERTLVYSIGVVPAAETGVYRDAFRRVNRSVVIDRCRPAIAGRGWTECDTRSASRECRRRSSRSSAT